MKWDNIRILSGCAGTECEVPEVNPTACLTENQEPYIKLVPEYAIRQPGTEQQYKTYFVDADGREYEITTNLEYTSSNAGIASINSTTGLALGVSAGITTITVNVNDGDAYATAQLEIVDTCGDKKNVWTFIVDNSVNMAETFPTTSLPKLTIAKQAVQQFIEAMNFTNNSIILQYSNTENDYYVAESIADAVEKLGTFIPQTTNDAALGDGVLFARNALAALAAEEYVADRRQIIVLISTGKNNAGINPLTQAQNFKTAGGIFMSLGICASSGGFTLLQQMASGGQFVNIISSEDLGDQFDTFEQLAYGLCGATCGDVYDCFNTPVPSQEQCEPEEPPVDPPIDVGTTLRWEMPCQYPHSGQTCLCINPPDQTTTVPGDEDTNYTVTVRIRGLVELKRYTGGSVVSTNLNKDGAPENITDEAWNEYSLLIGEDPDSPDDTYWLNRNPNAADSASYTIDYTFSFTVAGGTKLTLRADAVESFQAANIDDKTVEDVAPYPEPYDGQFLQMDIISIEEA